ncbi:MAG TPA: alpha/beta fold hydrolase [Caulobacteraceae bacterium]|nr:alpha/beta fold hydrolase [Caulobacteraceae bacterium]
MKCGRLEVPENWARPTARKIGLNIVVMPMTGPGPEQAPVIWLEGGPGIPGTVSAALYSTDLRFHRARRAVILFDQRGTGASAPLHCAETEQRQATEDMWPAALVTACRRRLEAEADLAQYTTAASAHDVDAIRAALGYSRVDLMGLSYGTMLGQAYMKLYPKRVRAAAFIGSVPLGEKLPLSHAANGENALRQVFADCRADPACHEAHPRLESDWRAVMARVVRQPVAVHTAKGEIVLRPGPLGEAVRGMLNSNFGQRRLPYLIGRAANADFTPFAAAIEAGGPEPEADGLYLSVTCPEGTRRIRPGEIELATARTSFGRYRVDRQVAACRLWAAAIADPRLLSPLASETPVLLLGGGRDATTPIPWARRIAAGLPHARVVVIEPMSHLPIGLTNIDCLDRIADAFFAKGDAEGLDTRCIASMKSPAFATR